MKKKYRVLAILLCAAMLCGTVACAKKENQDPTGGDGYSVVGTAGEGTAGQGTVSSASAQDSTPTGSNSTTDNGQTRPATTTAMATYAMAAEKAVAEASKAFSEGMNAMSPVATMTMPLPGVPIAPPPSDDWGKIIENPFISTAEQNISTFSADVDTASYTYFRKLASYGWSLDEIMKQAGSSIRTEEMINYFDYSYTEPGAGELFGVKTQMAQCPWNEQALLLQIGLKADDAVTAGGNNLVFLIDVSGSMMSEDKLPLLKTAFTYLTETLSSDDTVSIVTYSGREAVVLEGCRGTYTDEILRAVNGLEAKGSTNGQAGLQKAYEIAAKYFIEGGNNRIILASDGDLNVGIHTPEELKAFISERRDAGIYLTTLGFGTGNYRDANMEALADNGNGTYHYIDGAAEAEKIFSTDLLSTLYTVAEDVKMQITFDQSYVKEYRLVGYENRLLDVEDFEDDTKDAGEVGAGHTLTVCYELVLTDAAKTLTADMNLMKLAIRHKAPGEDVSRLNEYPVTGAAYTAAPDADFRFITAVAEFSMILHASDYTSQARLAEIYETLNALPLGDDDYKLAFRDTVKALLAKS